VCWWIIYQFLSEHASLHNGNTCCSCILGHHPISSALPDSAQTSLSMKRGEDARSWQLPDLNFLEYWLWGHINCVVYSLLNCDFVILQQRAENAGQEFGVKPGSLARVRTSVRRRAKGCVEHLLYESHEHRPYLSWHWFLDICTLRMVAHFSKYLYLVKTYKNFLNILYVYIS
jgi:hypothetical protein